jgi:hypothetical protein
VTATIRAKSALTHIGLREAADELRTLGTFTFSDLNKANATSGPPV